MHRSPMFCLLSCFRTIFDNRKCIIYCETLMILVKINEKLPILERKTKRMNQVSSLVSRALVFSVHLCPDRFP